MSQSDGYGTTETTGATENHDAVHNADDEEQPLLSRNNDRRKPPSNSIISRMRKCAMREVKRDWADIVLIFCYIITGMLDSSSISIWGSFVSMQTGNTVYIGLGLAAPTEGTRWIKSSTSLGFFCIGSFCFSRYHRFFSPKRRLTLVMSFALQSALCAGAAAIVTLGPQAAKDDITWNVLVPIALVAFQACGQAVTSRALKYNALTSVVLTSIYCDLFSDAELFRVQNAERNRRLGAPLMLLFGAIMGGLFAHSSVGVAGALWTAAVLKAVIVVVWALWPGEESGD